MNNRILKIIYIVVSLFFLAFVFNAQSPGIRGDGHEYILMSQSFLNHGTPQLREDKDVGDVVNSFRREDDKFTSTLYICGDEKDCGNSKYAMNGYFKDKYGKFYSYHFSFYSLINTPALLLTNNFDKTPTKSFYLTNAVFFLISIFFVLFFLKEPLIYRLSLLFFIVGQTTFLYMKWPHPESITVSLSIIAICLIKREKSLLASVIFAFASLQYPPLGLVAAIVLFYGVIIDAVESKQKSIIDVIKNKNLIIKYILFSFLSGLIVLIPSIFYLYHYGVPSLIATGWAKTDLISMRRFISMHYDLNQGSILLYPAVLLLTPIFTLLSILNIKKKSNRTVLLLVSLTIISTIPSLSTTNWNSGADNVMRYAFWASIPLVFAFIEYLFNIKNKIIFWILLLSSILIQLLTYALQYNNTYFSLKNLNSSNVALWAYKNIPTIYNPTPEIFWERLFGKEASFDQVYSEKGYPAFSHNGKLIKILVPNEYKMRGDLCVEEDTGTTFSDEGYTYINFKNGCTPLNPIADGITFIK
ncbi:Uncharacterised protein [Yersinia frederiksenii]|nr:hypothetical protein CBW53_15335 [Yersinia frederiksenii]CNJ00737.1 Uncharacterised protein [Yersinia frederiksenii]